MALITPGPIIGSISGTLSGTVFAYTKSGIIARRAPISTTSTSIPATNTRAALDLLHKQWTRLTEHQRRAWNSTASQYQYPSRLGTTTYLTGYTLYTRVNLPWILTAGITHPTPPSSLTPIAPLRIWAHALSKGPVTTTTYAPESQDQVPFHTALLHRFLPQSSQYIPPRGIRIGTQSTQHPTHAWDQLLALTHTQVIPGEHIALGESYQSPHYIHGPTLWAHAIVDNLPFTIEDFESGNLNPAWTPQTTYSLQSAITRSGTYALQSYIPSPGGHIAILYSPQGLPIYPIRGHTWHHWTRTATTAGYHGILYGVQNQTQYFRLRFLPSANILQIHRIDPPLSPLLLQLPFPWLPHTWYRVQLTHRPKAPTTLTIFNEHGSPLITGSYTDPSFALGYIACYHAAPSNTTSTAYWDDFQITGPAT